MNIRKANNSDIENILKIYACARHYMIENGNPTQWSATYPEEAIIKEDIQKGHLHVCVENDEVVGVFVFFIGNDPTYSVIKDGEWHSNKPYGVIHRVASNGKARGVAKACFDYAKSQADYLRIDTHNDNKTMQAVIQKNGFIRCGIIHVANGSERIAFDFVR